MTLQDEMVFNIVYIYNTYIFCMYARRKMSPKTYNFFFGAGITHKVESIERHFSVHSPIHIRSFLVSDSFQFHFEIDKISHRMMVAVTIRFDSIVFWARFDPFCGQYLILINISIIDDTMRQTICHVPHIVSAGNCVWCDVMWCGNLWKTVFVALINPELEPQSVCEREWKCEFLWPK